MNSKKEIAVIMVSSVTVFVLAFFGVFMFLKLRELPKFSLNDIKNNIPHGYIVQSGSMEPTIKTGSIVLSAPSQSYWIGDVITFAQRPGSRSLVTHRIMNRTYPEGVDKPAVYQTSGDANEDFDPGSVSQEQIVGKVLLTIPYLGYIANFAKQPYGFLLLVIVPATIVIYEELKTLLGGFGTGLRELLIKIRKKKDKALEGLVEPKKVKNKDEESSLKITRNLISGASILLPVFGALMVLTGVAMAYFNDRELSSNNVLQAGAWSSPTPTPPPIAVTLVINEVLPDASCSQGQTEAQWLEIYNGYPNTVDLHNYKITDGTNTIDVVNAANSNIAHGQFVLLAHSTAIFGNGKCYPDNGAQVLNLGGTLNIDVGHLQLLDPSQNNAVIDDVQWGPSFPSLNPSQNQSIERNPDGLDSATGANFNASDFVIRSTPQPGI